MNSLFLILIAGGAVLAGYVIRVFQAKTKISSAEGRAEKRSNHPCCRGAGVAARDGDCR